MVTKDYKQVLELVKKKEFENIYLLQGEEPYYIDLISKQIQEKSLTEDQRVFDETILYGNDLNVKQLMLELKRYPILGNKHLVILREGQNLKNIEQLDILLEENIEYLIFVICYKKNVDKRKKFYKTISKKGMIFESSKLYEHKIVPWIISYLKKKNLEITPKSANLVVEALGNDLGKIVKELDKIASTKQKKEIITGADIEKYIGISNEYNIFELTKSIGINNTKKSFNIIFRFAENPKKHPIVLTILMLYNYFNKLLIYLTEKDRNPQNLASKLGINQFFLKDYEQASKNYNIKKCIYALECIGEADKKMKGFQSPVTSDKEILIDLLFKILN